MLVGCGYGGFWVFTGLVACAISEKYHTAILQSAPGRSFLFYLSGTAKFAFGVAILGFVILMREQYTVKQGYDYSFSTRQALGTGGDSATRPPHLKSSIIGSYLV